MIRRLQLLIFPTVKLMKFMTSCGADGDLGFLVYLVMGMIMLATFPIWVGHFMIQRIVKQLGEQGRMALDDLDELGVVMGDMCFVSNRVTLLPSYCPTSKPPLGTLHYSIGPHHPYRLHRHRRPTASPPRRLTAIQSTCRVHCFTAPWLTTGRKLSNC